MGRAGPFRERRLQTYRDATEYLGSLVRTPPRTRSERDRLGLAPIERLLDRIGNPHRRVAAIHITGSKGKGSTALHTEALLAAAGMRAGTFTSPHLEDWTERVRVDGAPVDQSRFVAALERVRPAIEDLREADPDSAPAFFDALVAAAFSTFATASVDVAVVEAGIGARLDPTRVCHAVATCITGVELEHADRLGPTIADIAREKAAIARPGVPLVLGRVPDAVQRVVALHASRVGAPIRCLGREIEVRFDTAQLPPESTYGNLRAGIANRSSTPLACSVSERTEVCLAGRTIPVTLRQPGRRMLENAALALGLANEAGALSRLDDAAAGAALGATVLPGRMEVLQENPLVVVDGAHTRASIDALLEMLEARRRRPLVAVVSVTRGKDSGAILSPLVLRADAVFATAADASRSLRADELGHVLVEFAQPGSVTAQESPADALRAAINAAGHNGMVCVTGSMYMAGAARRLLARLGRKGHNKQ